MYNQKIRVNHSVKLLYRENIEMLVQEEQLKFMKVLRISYTSHNNIHHLLIHVFFSVEVAGVEEHSDSNGVISQTNDKQFLELFWRYVAFLRRSELLVVVFFAVHLEHRVNIFGRCQEALAVVGGYSRLNLIINDYLFEEGLAVPAVS